MSGSTNLLGAGFPSRDAGDWMEQVALDLKGADPGRLRSRTEDDIVVEPLYVAGEFLEVPRRAPGRIERLARVGSEGNGRIADAILHELENGAQGVLLDVSVPGHVAGLAADPADWDEVFESLPAGGALHLRAQADQIAHARAWLESDAFDAHLGASLGLDPFRVAARTGDFAGLDDALSSSAALAAEALAHPACPRAFDLDADPFSAAGATTAQSVGCLIAAYVQALRALEAANVDPARGCGMIGLALRLDPRFFEQIAALRALRLLHAQLLRSCGIEGPLHLTALPAERMLSQRDPWVNMLRTTTTGFSALVGGADAVGAAAFDSRLERDSAAGRRIARNTPTILEEESHLTRVQDPAAGSWFLDELTREVAKAGWAFFQEIEGEGGLVAVMRSGWLLERLREKHEERAAKIARRRMPRTGVSEFANLAEELPAPVASPHSAPRGGWPRHSFDEGFETLRAAADRHALTHPRPRVFLARAGNPASYSAREAWLVNLFAAAGIESIAGDPCGDAAGEFVASGAATAILTMDDGTLAGRGPGLAQALGQFGAVWAAGKPADALRTAGVAEFVHVGVDVVDALGRLLEAQGVGR